MYTFLVIVPTVGIYHAPNAAAAVFDTANSDNCDHIVDDLVTADSIMRYSMKRYYGIWRSTYRNKQEQASFIRLNACPTTGRIFLNGNP